MWMRVWLGCTGVFLLGEAGGLASSGSFAHWTFLAAGAFLSVATAQIAEHAAKRGIR